MLASPSCSPGLHCAAPGTLRNAVTATARCREPHAQFQGTIELVRKSKVAGRLPRRCTTPLSETLVWVRLRRRRWRESAVVSRPRKPSSFILVSARDSALNGKPAESGHRPDPIGCICGRRVSRSHWNTPPTEPRVGQRTRQAHYSSSGHIGTVQVQLLQILQTWLVPDRVGLHPQASQWSCVSAVRARVHPLLLVILLLCPARMTPRTC